MAGSKMTTTNYLVFALLLVGSLHTLRVSCDAVSGQVEFQQQQQTLPQPAQQQPSELQSQGQAPVDPAASGQANNGQQQLGGAAGAAAAGAGAGAGADGSGAAGAAAAAAAAGGAAGTETQVWQQSPLYLATFDPEILVIPQMQRDFVNQIVANDLELFREILRDAIDRRNKFAPSVGLIWKYAAKLIGRFISNRREEMQLTERIEPKPEFFRMLADLADAVITQSTEVKKERGYSKNNIDTEDLYRRVDGLFKYIQQTIEAAPIGAYMKWNELIVFKGDATNPDHDRPIVDIASELTAQFRAMGYESCTFVARRIVNLLRMFSKGSIPTSDKDV